MSALPPGDRRRLAASLALLASPIDGEVVAAARAVKRVLDKHGLDMASLTMPLVSFEPLAADEGVGPVRDRRAQERDHQRLAHVLLRTGRAWSTWERGFLESMSRQVMASAGQRDKLEELRIAVIGRKVAA